MNLFIRTDSSFEIGSGHVMRCLTFAKTMQAQGHHVSFICREHDGNFSELLESQQITLYRLPAHRKQKELSPVSNDYQHWLGTDWITDAEQTIAHLSAAKQTIDWLIVDHYALDAQWEKKMRPWVKNIMVIDDLANRPHDCDLLLDQNQFKHLEHRYQKLVSKQCRCLLGPQFALLNPDFRKYRSKIKKRDGIIRKIFICYGGVDKSNQTTKSLLALSHLDTSQMSIDIVIGKQNPNKNLIQKMCSERPNITLYHHVSNIAELMAQADLALGASGTMTWERCCLGIPSLVSVLADNQAEIARTAAEEGFVIYLGHAKDITADDIKRHLQELFLDKQRLQSVSLKSMQLVDGLGAQRVYDQLNNHGKS